MKKIIICLALCVMALSLLCTASPLTAPVLDTAEEKETAELQSGIYQNVNASLLEGDGTQTSPYKISSADAFNSYAALIKSNNAVYGTAYYELTGNIDFTGKALVPFGTATTPFMGHLEGNGYGILGIEIQDVECFGVIGYMTQGSVKNLAAEYIAASKSYNTLNVFGGIIGYAYTDSLNTITVSCCEASGDVVFSSNGDIYAGGIVGRVYANRANILFLDSVSYINFDINAVEASIVGGFGGHLRASSSMYFQFYKCIAYGDVSLVTTGNRNQCGGFAGYVYKDEPGWVEVDKASLDETIYHFYISLAYGDVYTKCSRTARVGGFAGKVDNPAYVTFYGNHRHMNQKVEGEAKFVELCEMVNNTYADELYNKNFIKNSLGYSMTNTWYYSTTDSRVYLRITSKKNGAAALRENASMRLSEERAGLRFIADIETYKRDYVYEYGFIITTEDHLGDNELTFDFDGKYAYGAAYDTVSENKLDIFYDKTDNNIMFTGVLYNIPTYGYGKIVVARTYVKYEIGGVTHTVYGNTVKASVNEVAAAIKNDDATFNALTEDQKQIFANMFPAL